MNDHELPQDETEGATLSFRASAELLRRLERHRKKEKYPPDRSEVLRRALERYLEDEDAPDKT